MLWGKSANHCATKLLHYCFITSSPSGTHTSHTLFSISPQKMLTHCRAELLTWALGSDGKTQPRRWRHPGSVWMGKQSIDRSINLYCICWNVVFNLSLSPFSFLLLPCCVDAAQMHKYSTQNYLDTVNVIMNLYQPSQSFGKTGDFCVWEFVSCSFEFLPVCSRSRDWSIPKTSLT